MEENYNLLVSEYQDYFAYNFLPNLTSFESNITYDLHQPRVPAFNSSTSEETDEASGHMIIINERKHRRMISNRESARRSRVRKQRQLDELCAQVAWLRDENHGLVVKLNRLLESHGKVVEENKELKKESLELKKLVSEAQLDNTYTSLGDLYHDDGEGVHTSCIGVSSKA